MLNKFVIIFVVFVLQLDVIAVWKPKKISFQKVAKSIKFFMIFGPKITKSCNYYIFFLFKNCTFLQTFVIVDIENNCHYVSPA